MADQLNFTINRAVDANGDPAPGAKAYFYQSGTNTLRTVYTTEDATVAHASPVVADAQGVFPAVFATGACKVLITDAAGVTLTGYPMDPVFLVPTAATGANRISFDPTAEIPATNVQDAIEQVQENLTAPLADLGLGVTGNAALLANLDAANTASGFYRYDGTTTGTFPAGVTAADGGIVLLWRETSAEAFMVLIPGGVAETHYKRTLTVSSWGSWVQNVIDEDSFATNSATRPPSQQSVKAYVDATVATSGKVKAWVNFVGTGTVSINNSYNVTSITDLGTGRYLINFTNALASADYAVSGFARDSNDSGDPLVVHQWSTDDFSTTQLGVRTTQGSGAVVDCPLATVMVIL